MATIQKYKLRLVEDGTAEFPVEYIRTAGDSFYLFQEAMKDLPHEEVMVVYLNGKLRILGMATLAMGGLHGCALTPKDVFRGAITICASAIILAHNHPSGDPLPSAEDIRMTERLIDVGKMVGVDVLDHLVIVDGTYSCIRERIKNY